MSDNNNILNTKLHSVSIICPKCGTVAGTVNSVVPASVIDNFDVQPTSYLAAETDPTVSQIMGSGTTPNRRLFRRWVTGQMFHMLACGYISTLTKRGLPYAWKVTVEEFRVQAKLYQCDKESFYERNRWFNVDVLKDMILNYIDFMPREKSRLRIYYRNGTRCYRLRRTYVSELDFERVVYHPLCAIRDSLTDSSTPEDVYKAAKAAYTHIKQCLLNKRMGTPLPFVRAYQGSGAFFTLKNMILFHGVRIERDGKKLSGVGSLSVLFQQAEEMKGNGQPMFDYMNCVLSYNNIDIRAKMAEWRK